MSFQEQDGRELALIRPLLSWVVICASLIQALCTRSPLYFMAAGHSLLFCTISFWLLHGDLASSSSKKNFALEVTGGVIMCSVASVRLMSSAWQHLPMEETPVWFDIGRGWFLGAMIYYIRECVAREPRMQGRSDGVLENQENQDDMFVGSLGRSHPLYTIEEQSETSISSTGDAIFFASTTLRHDNLHSECSSSWSQTGSEDCDSSSHSCPLSVALSPETSSDDQHDLPDLEGEETLTAFRHFLSEDRAKVSQQDKQRRTRKSSKHKRRRRRGAKDKNGRTTATSSSSLSTDKPFDRSSGSVCETENERQALDQQNMVTTNSISNISSASKPPTVRFADEDGQDIQVVHEAREDSVYAFQRLLVLLILPTERVFEFVGLEYSTTADSAEETILVEQILQQLPLLATDPSMTKEHFVRLIRWNSNAEHNGELNNTVPIQSCNLMNDEVVVALPAGSSPHEIIESSKQVLQDRKLMRAVRRHA